jgi:hypothetical protein
MPYYDPAMEALVTALLRILNPSIEEPAVLTYIEQLRAVQAALVALLAGTPQPTGLAKSMEAVTPAEEALEEAFIRFALGKLNPKPEDQWLAKAEVVSRLLECIDVELSRWTSAVEQAPGPSGAASLPPAETVA